MGSGAASGVSQGIPINRSRKAVPGRRLSWVAAEPQFKGSIGIRKNKVAQKGFSDVLICHRAMQVGRFWWGEVEWTRRDPASCDCQAENRLTRPIWWLNRGRRALHQGYEG